MKRTLARARSTLIALALLIALLAATSIGCTGDDTSVGTPDAAASCPTGATACGGSCVSLKSDSDNCGACGVACGALQICDLGVCTASIVDGGARDATAAAPSDASNEAAAPVDAAQPADASSDASIEAAPPVDASDGGG